MGTLFQDLRYGLRMLAKNPGFTAVAVLTLALGIGANTAMFGVVNAVLLRPLPFHDPGRLVAIEGIPVVKFNGLHNRVLGWEDWVSRTQTLEDVTIFEQGGVNLAGGSEPEHVPAAAVSGGFFRLLGVGPVRGRTLLPEEDAPGQTVAVVSYELWQGYLRADPNIIGKKIDLAQRPFTVIGVMSPGFEFPADTQVWIPEAANQEESLFAEGGRALHQVARLKPGITLGQVRAELEVFLKQSQEGSTASLNPSFSVMPLKLKLVGDMRPALLVLMGAVGLVLLIACANVSNLLMARNVGHCREVAIRAAIGASRGRLIRQLLTETVLLSTLGGLAGLLVGEGGIRLARVLVPANQTQSSGILLDGWVLGFMILLAGLTGVMAGLLPAFGSSKVALCQALKEGAGGTASGLGFARQHRARTFLGVGEMALALILLIGAGLLIKSLAALSEVKLGIRTDHLITARLFLAGPSYSAPNPRAAFYERLLDRAHSLAGVREAAFVNSLPLGQGVSVMFSLGIEGSLTPSPETSDKWALYLTISPGYLGTMGIPLLEGREFNYRDRSGAPGVVIVSQTMARRFWAGQDPIGKRITRFSPPQWMTVVGVAGDVRQWNLSDEPEPEMYVTILQDPPPSAFLALHTSAPVGAADIAQAVRGVDDAQPLAANHTIEELVARATTSPRFRALVLGIFAGLALFLAVFGIYGIMSYTVSRRTHEFGIRMALGAEGRDVLSMVLGQGLRLTMWGVIVGLAGAAGLTRLLASFLYGVRPLDLFVFASAALALTVTALSAVCIPARRATKVDPMVALRYE